MTVAEAVPQPRRLPPPSAAVQALVVAARRRAVLDDESLRRLGMRAVRAGARSPAQLRAWLRGGDCTPRLADRLEPLLPSLADAGISYGGFTLLAHLADGGMGRVYLAGDDADRMVVVKTLKPEYSANELFVARFEREAGITARLDHGNLVRGLGHGRTPHGQLWMALEYVPGGDLASLIEGGVRLSEPEALLIVLQVARALEFADRLRLIHRDIKPSNILLAFDGSAKLADFGLARSTGHDGSLHTVKGAAIGSPSFMSPEQINGQKDLDIRADLYSLGCVLFFVLTGRPPYQAEEPLEIMRMHMRDDLPDVRAWRPELHVRTAKTILKLMQKDRALRYQTPTRLVESLEKTLRLLGSEPSQPLAEQTISRSVRREQAADSVSFDPTPAHELTLAGGDAEAVATLRDSQPPPRPAELALAIGQPRLTIRSRGAYQATLVLVGQEQVVFGKLRGPPVDIPLRVYPIDVFEPECMRVSRSQCRLWADAAGRAHLEDLGSANGTILDGRMLNPQAPAALEQPRDHHVEIPRAIRLAIRPVPQRTRREQAVGAPPAVGLDSAQSLDAITIRRMDNRPSLAYALVLRRITIGSTQADLMLQNWIGPDLELALFASRWIWRPLGDVRWCPVLHDQLLGTSSLQAALGGYDDFR